MGLWVLRQALEQCVRWRRSRPDFHISVNMSYSQFGQGSIENDVLGIWRESGLPPGALTIEVTESVQLLDYSDLNRIFRRWKKAGIEIAVDDFGTGYSSLGRLKEMEVDEIKIDRCFVRNIQNSAYNYRLLRNMFELADSCQIRVCCEGVETAEELAVLEDLHPGLLQGFLIARPCPAGAFEARYILSSGGKLYHPQLPAPAAGEREDSRAEDESEFARAILEAENDIFFLCDMETYELCYLNPAGQRVFGVRDYQGRKC